MLVTHWTLCEEAGPRQRPYVRPGLQLNHDAGLFHWSLCVVIVSRLHPCEGVESHWNFYESTETEVGCRMPPGELGGSELLLIHG